MKLLIDECLPASRTGIANTESYEVHHVDRQGWIGTNRSLAARAGRERRVLCVTNNARDFRKLMAEAELHAGLIVIVPNVRPIEQSELLERTLREIARLLDLIKQGGRDRFRRTENL